MAQSDSSLTPEQRLLKLIESGQSPTPAPSGAKPGQAKTGAPGGGAKLPFSLPLDSIARIFSPTYIQGKISYLAENWQKLLKPPKLDEIDLKKVNAFLKVAVVVMGAFFAANVVFEFQSFQKDAQAYSEVPQKEIADIIVAEPKVFDDNFFEEMVKRNIFVPIDKRVVKKAETSEISLKLLEITQQLKLVGISIHPTDPKRTFCMIEDLKKNMTTFLRVGDSISGIKVEKINPDNVMLAFQQERMELR